MPARRHLLCITLAAMIGLSFSAASAAEIFTTACADFNTTIGTICGGTYSTTTTSNDVRECLQEGLQGTKSKLNHIWKFCNVPAGTLSLVYEGLRAANPDGDNFQFAYNTTGQSFGLVIEGAIISHNFEATGGLTVPLNFTSTAPTDIYLIIYDTVATGTHLATVNLDYLAIKSETQDLCTDGDGDGYAASCSGCSFPTCPTVDCDDADPQESPGLTEGPPGNPTCSDAKDNNCNGLIDSADTAACVLSDVCASSDYSTGPGIITSGSYQSTCVSDDAREVFQETIQSGKSKLRHKWQFLSVPAGSSHDLVVEGFRPDNADGENFLFAYNTNCTQSFGIVLDCVIGSPSETTVTCPFDGSVSGTICVHMYDSVAAGNDLDTVQVDKVVIRTNP